MFKKKEKKLHPSAIKFADEVERIHNGTPTLDDAMNMINRKNFSWIKACLNNPNSSSDILDIFINEYEGLIGINGKTTNLTFKGYAYDLFTHPNLTTEQVSSLLWAALSFDYGHTNKILNTHKDAVLMLERHINRKLLLSERYHENKAYIRLFEAEKSSDEIRLILIKSCSLIPENTRENAFKRLLSNTNLTPLILKRIRYETKSETALKLIGLHRNVTLEIINTLPEKLQFLSLENFNRLKEQKSQITEKVFENENYKPLIDPETPEELARSEKRKNDMKVITKRFIESRSLANTLVKDLDSDLPSNLKSDFETAVNKLNKTLTFYKDVSNGPLTLQGEEAYVVALMRIENSLTNYENVISSFINLIKISETANETNEQLDTLRIDTKAWSDIKVFESKL